MEHARKTQKQIPSFSINEYYGKPKQYQTNIPFSSSALRKKNVEKLQQHSYIINLKKKLFYI